MLVTLTGAYRNAGDHLIGTRGRALLSTYVDSDIVNIDRKNITDEHYEVFNEAKAVILLGGPAYQGEIFPKIYPIDLDRIKTRVIPMGLGWKGSLGQAPESFEFSEASKDGVLSLHKKIKTSSVRDVLTLQMIRHQGITNVEMTGCPAWYKLDALDKDYTFQGEVKNIALSLPAKPYRELVDLITEIGKMFPKAKKTMVFHHGWKPSNSNTGKAMFKWHLKLAAFGALKDWGAVSVADGLDKFERVYSDADLHLGYRVHSHIFSLSNRSASILVNEDTRGVGQVQTLGGEILMAGGGAKPILKAIEQHLATQGENSANGVAVMKKTFPTMLKFLETI
jgi:hypothetical protein